MKEVRPVMPWVKIYINKGSYVYALYLWCIDNLGPNGVNWYVGTGDAGVDLFFSFRYDEDAIAFKLKFGL